MGSPLRLFECNLELKKGEILGIAGVRVMAKLSWLRLSPVWCARLAEIWFDGRLVLDLVVPRLYKPALATSEDRLRRGLIPTFSIAQNVIFRLPQFFYQTWDD